MSILCGIYGYDYKGSRDAAGYSGKIKGDEDCMEKMIDMVGRRIINEVL
jgi:hypothetical protein